MSSPAAAIDSLTYFVIVPTTFDPADIAAAIERESGNYDRFNDDPFARMVEGYSDEPLIIRTASS